MAVAKDRDGRRCRSGIYTWRAHGRRSATPSAAARVPRAAGVDAHLPRRLARRRRSRARGRLQRRQARRAHATPHPAVLRQGDRAPVRHRPRDQLPRPLAGYRGPARRRRLGREPAAASYGFSRRAADVLRRHPRPRDRGARQPRRDGSAHRAGEPPGAARDRRAGPPGQPRRLSGRGRQRLGHRRAPRARARPRQRVALAPDRPRLDRRRGLRRPRGCALRPEPAVRRPDRRARQPRLDRLRRLAAHPVRRATRRASRARRSWPRPTSPSRSRQASSPSGPGRSRSSSTSRSRSASSSRLRSSRAACPR